LPDGFITLPTIIDTFPITSSFRPHPSSPKSNDENFESAFGLWLIVFEGGAEGGGATIKIHNESVNHLLPQLAGYGA